MTKSPYNQGVSSYKNMVIRNEDSKKEEPRLHWKLSASTSRRLKEHKTTGSKQIKTSSQKYNYYSPANVTGRELVILGSLPVVSGS